MTGAELLVLVGQHAAMAAAALMLGSCVGIPFGIAAASNRRVRGPVVAIATVGRTLPSIAVLTLALPLLGVGFVPAICALTLLAVPPIVINTDVGLRGVAPAAIDAARGLGMTPQQVFARVAWPLALGSVVAGVRTAAIEVVASASLATFIGAGGLGFAIVQGLQTGNDAELYLGAVLVAALAFIVEGCGAWYSRALAR